MALVTKSFSDIITFTRASTGTFFNSSGVLTSAAINAPRFDYNPATLAARGLLIEEQRTNSIRNNTMQGAVAGTPGTDPTNWTTTAVAGNVTAKQIVSVGTENGINYVDIRYTTSGAVIFNVCVFETITQIVAANTQTWASSLYVKLAGGSLSNLTLANRIVFRDAVGTALTVSDANFTPTTAALSTQRPSASFTATDASTARVTNAVLANATGATDFTLRIGLPQLELGAFATSVIPTTTTALTRSADVASVNTLSPWYNQTEGTVYAELQSLSPLTGVQSVALNKYPHVWQIEAGASDSTLWCYGLNSELYIATTFNNIGAVPSGINKIAVALAASGGQSRSSLNGAAAVNRNGTLTGTATLFSLGKDSTNGINNFLNGYLRRLTYYPRALSAAELQAITA